MNANGTPGKEGDKHYKCYHGTRKILTITRAMRSSLNGIFILFLTETRLLIGSNSLGLIGHLKNYFPAMYRLYLLLKDRTEPPTEEEKAIAAACKSLDPTMAAEYLKKLEKASTNIVDLFNQQHRQTAVSFFPCSSL